MTYSIVARDPEQGRSGSQSQAGFSHVDRWCRMSVQALPSLARPS